MPWPERNRSRKALALGSHRNPLRRRPVAIALVMLLVKLFGNDGQKRRQAPPPLQTGRRRSRRPPHPPGLPATKKAVRSAMKSPAVKKSNAKWLKIIGAVLAVCGLRPAGPPSR